MRARTPDDLILAVHATKKGYAFVLFEGPQSPFDWAISDFASTARNEKVVASVTRIIALNQPSVLVLEDTSERADRRTARIRRLYQLLVHVAHTHVIDVHRYPRKVVQQTFLSAGAKTKREVAQAIARQIPAFAPRLPYVRMPWMSQDSRQGLFDAAALGLTYYAHRIPSPYDTE